MAYFVQVFLYRMFRHTLTWHIRLLARLRDSIPPLIDLLFVSQNMVDKVSNIHVREGVLDCQISSLFYVFRTEITTKKQTIYMDTSLVHRMSVLRTHNDFRRLIQ